MEAKIKSGKLHPHLELDEQVYVHKHHHGTKNRKAKNAKKASEPRVTHHERHKKGHKHDHGHKDNKHEHMRSGRRSKSKAMSKVGGMRKRKGQHVPHVEGANEAHQHKFDPSFTQANIQDRNVEDKGSTTTDLEENEQDTETEATDCQDNDNDTTVDEKKQQAQWPSMTVRTPTAQQLGNQDDQGGEQWHKHLDERDKFESSSKPHQTTMKEKQQPHHLAKASDLVTLPEDMSPVDSTRSGEHEGEDEDDGGVGQGSGPSYMEGEIKEDYEPQRSPLTRAHEKGTERPVNVEPPAYMDEEDTLYVESARSQGQAAKDQSNQTLGNVTEQARHIKAIVEADFPSGITTGKADTLLMGKTRVGRSEVPASSLYFNSLEEQDEKNLSVQYVPGKASHFSSINRASFLHSRHRHEPNHVVNMVRALESLDWTRDFIGKPTESTSDALKILDSNLSRRSEEPQDTFYQTPIHRRVNATHEKQHDGIEPQPKHMSNVSGNEAKRGPVETRKTPMASHTSPLQPYQHLHKKFNHVRHSTGRCASQEEADEARLQVHLKSAAVLDTAKVPGFWAFIALAGRRKNDMSNHPVDSSKLQRVEAPAMLVTPIELSRHSNAVVSFLGLPVPLPVNIREIQSGNQWNNYDDNHQQFVINQTYSSTGHDGNDSGRPVPVPAPNPVHSNASVALNDTTQGQSYPLWWGHWNYHIKAEGADSFIATTPIASSNASASWSIPPTQSGQGEPEAEYLPATDDSTGKPSTASSVSGYDEYIANGGYAEYGEMETNGNISKGIGEYRPYSQFTNYYHSVPPHVSMPGGKTGDVVHSWQGRYSLIYQNAYEQGPTTRDMEYSEGAEEYAPAEPEHPMASQHPKLGQYYPNMRPLTAKPTDNAIAGFNLYGGAFGGSNNGQFSGSFNYGQKKITSIHHSDSGANVNVNHPGFRESGGRQSGSGAMKFAYNHSQWLTHQWYGHTVRHTVLEQLGIGRAALFTTRGILTEDTKPPNRETSSIGKEEKVIYQGRPSKVLNASATSYIPPMQVMGEPFYGILPSKGHAGYWVKLIQSMRASQASGGKAQDPWRLSNHGQIETGKSHQKFVVPNMNEYEGVFRGSGGEDSARSLVRSQRWTLPPVYQPRGRMEKLHSWQGLLMDSGGKRRQSQALQGWSDWNKGLSAAEGDKGSSEGQQDSVHSHQTPNPQSLPQSPYTGWWLKKGLQRVSSRQAAV